MRQNDTSLDYGLQAKGQFYKNSSYYYFSYVRIMYYVDGNGECVVKCHFKYCFVARFSFYLFRYSFFSDWVLMAL